MTTDNPANHNGCAPSGATAGSALPDRGDFVEAAKKNLGWRIATACEVYDTLANGTLTPDDMDRWAQDFFDR